MLPSQKPRWRIRLEKELSYRHEFDLDRSEWEDLLRRSRVTSSNHDTILSLDWPHFCSHATEACGGPEGWCYTFQGHQASAGHNRHAAMVDALARFDPELFAIAAEREVLRAVKAETLPYPNLRYSGSGEATLSHLPALEAIAKRGVRLWGFTRDLKLGESLLQLGCSVIFSADRTTASEDLLYAQRSGISIAYTAESVEEKIPEGTVVTFPVHRVGRVKEVPDVASLCPKVLLDFFEESRPPGVCQYSCTRCHQMTRIETR